MASDSDKGPGHNHLETGYAFHCAAVPSWGRGRDGQGPGPMPGCQTHKLGASLRLKGESSHMGSREHEGQSFSTLSLPGLVCFSEMYFYVPQ